MVQDPSGGIGSGGGVASPSGPSGTGGGSGTGLQGPPAQTGNQGKPVLDYIIGKQDKVAHTAKAHGTHAHHHKNLKSMMDGIPKDIFQQGMAGIMNLLNMVSGIMKMAQAHGGNMGAVGNFGNTLGKIGQQLGKTGNLQNLNVSSINQIQNPDQLFGELVAAVGPAAALGLSMIGATSVDLTNITNAVNGTGDTTSQDNATLPSFNPDATTPINPPPVTPVIGDAETPIK